MRSIVAGMRSVGSGVRSFILDIVGARAFQASVVALVAGAVFFLLPSRVLSPADPVLVVPSPAPIGAGTSGAAAEFLNDAAVDGDASLTLVASLTSTLDADGASETGLAKVGSAEHAVTHMNDADLRELHRLLQEEMAP
jgi:hypothetical protein